MFDDYSSAMTTMLINSQMIMLMVVMMMLVNAMPYQKMSDIQPVPPSSGQPSVRTHLSAGDKKDVILSTGVHDSVAELSAADSLEVTIATSLIGVTSLCHFVTDSF